MFGPLFKGIGLATSPKGRRVIRGAIVLAQTPQGRKMLRQAQLAATNPENRKRLATVVKTATVKAGTSSMAAFDAAIDAEESAP